MSHISFDGFWYLVFESLAFTNPKANHHLLFLAIFPDLELLQFWSVNIYARSVNYTFILEISEF